MQEKKKKNEGIDSTTKLCGTFKNDFVINSLSNLCVECQDTQCLLCSRNL